MRYTLTGSAEFEASIDRDMQRIAAAVQDKLANSSLVAVILGGGYGRGEGGVGRDSEGREQLHNDYDLFPVTRGAGRSEKKRLNAVLQKISAELEEETGIDVDFGPATNVSELPHTGFTRMWQDLRHGYRVVWGDEHVLDALPEYDICKMPVIEGVRLMLNRGAGLLFCREKLEHGDCSDEDLDFIRRNLFKALNACGDVQLIIREDYDSSYAKRLEKMRAMSDQFDAAFFALYEQSIEYKLAPAYEVLSKTEISARFEQVMEIFRRCWFELLRCYLQLSGDASEDMVTEEMFRRGGGDAPCCIFTLAKNLILNFKEVGIVGFSLKFYIRHPRNRLFCTLPLILFDKPLKQVYITRCLGVSSDSDMETCRKKFIKLWYRFN